MGEQPLPEAWPTHGCALHQLPVTATVVSSVMKRSPWIHRYLRLSATLIHHSSTT